MALTGGEYPGASRPGRDTRVVFLRDGRPTEAWLKRVCRENGMYRSHLRGGTEAEQVYGHAALYRSNAMLHVSPRQLWHLGQWYAVRPLTATVSRGVPQTGQQPPL
jgi:hypothetical protein